MSNETRTTPPASEVSPELQLLLDWNDSQASGIWFRVLAGSIALHLLLFLIAVRTPAFIERSRPERRVVHSVPLYLPPDLLTQRAPNRRELTKNIELADLQAIQDQQARRTSPGRSVRHFELPKKLVPQPVAKVAPPQLPPQITPELPQPFTPPPARTSPAPPVNNSTQNAAVLPPPAAKPGPFQNLEPEAPLNPNPTLRPPHMDLRNGPGVLAASRDGRQASITNDSDGEATPGTPGTVGNNIERHAAVELKSDPQGADFKPYLSRILAIVRSNWKRVIPESVRAGSARGRTTVEFIITRDGQIPKMVTASSSGSPSLDRAAVAGLSMSNPLPPLPPDFKGYQVRLAFSFDYNMPR